MFRKNKHQKHWRSITNPGTKEELRFATKTLGEYGEGWEWMNKPPLRFMKKLIPQFAVGIPRNEYNRIDKKYSIFAKEGKEVLS